MVPLITIDAANRLSSLVGMEDKVRFRHGDGQKLPYGNEEFDGGYTQHVTMNVPNRTDFFTESFRVLKPGAFFALTEHGLGEVGKPHQPVPWSEDGSGAYLMRPEVIASCTNEVWYPNPNAAATALVDAEVLAHPAVYPSEAAMARLFPLQTRPARQKRSITQSWNRMKIGL